VVSRFPHFVYFFFGLSDEFSSTSSSPDLLDLFIFDEFTFLELLSSHQEPALLDANTAAPD
jgi:hypothetical protein